MLPIHNAGEHTYIVTQASPELTTKRNKVQQKQPISKAPKINHDQHTKHLPISKASEHGGDMFHGRCMN